MRDPAHDPNIVGYCGILVASAQEYQGFFIDRRAEADGRAMLERTKTAAKFMPDLTLARTVVPAEAGNMEARMLGTLCAAAAALARHGRAEVAAVLAAIRLQTGHDFYWIEAREEPAGTTTRLCPLEGVRTAEAAREAFQARPEVMLADMMRLLGSPKGPG